MWVAKGTPVAPTRVKLATQRFEYLFWTLALHLTAFLLHLRQHFYVMLAAEHSYIGSDLFTILVFTESDLYH